MTIYSHWEKGKWYSEVLDVIFSTSVLIYETIGIVSDQRIINLAVGVYLVNRHMILQAVNTYLISELVNSYNIA